MGEYEQLLARVLLKGKPREDRTGTGTLSMFGYQTRFDLRKGFPLVTTKRVHFPSIKGELLWFLSGSTNKFDLKNNYGVSIWDEWGDDLTGELGPVYGKQWRSWEYDNETIDQIQQAIDTIRFNPDSRRILVNAWNVGEVKNMALPPCHLLFQFYVEDKYLDVQLYQRSADMFLGVPFNIASYALLLSLVAQVTGKTARYFIHSFGDMHIYQNHVEQVELQLSREPYPYPKLWLNPSVNNIDDFTMDDIKLVDYVSHPSIKAPVAI